MPEALRQPLGLMKPQQDETPEELLDGLDVERRKRQEIALEGEDALGEQAVRVWVEISP